MNQSMMERIPVLVVGGGPVGLSTALALSRFGVLAGDAAHQMTPMGAFGMNTAIQDAHNLAWKLAAVLGGWATPELLNTYAAERRPVAERTVELSRKLWESGGPDNVDGDLGLVLGFAYQSTPVVSEGPSPTGDVDATSAFARTSSSVSALGTHRVAYVMSV